MSKLLLSCNILVTLAVTFFANTALAAEKNSTLVLGQNQNAQVQSKENTEQKENKQKQDAQALFEESLRQLMPPYLSGLMSKYKNIAHILTNVKGRCFPFRLTSILLSERAYFINKKILVDMHLKQVIMSILLSNIYEDMLAVRVSLESGRKPVKVFTTANIATSLVFHDAPV